MAVASAQTPRTRLRRAAGGLVALAAVGTLCGGWIVARAAAASGPSTVLEVDPVASVRFAQAVAGTDLVFFERYGAAQLWSSERTRGGRCLLLAYPDDEAGDDRLRIERVDCVPVGLEPVIDVRTEPGTPLAANTDRPLGATVRFVLQADHVEVWLATPPTGASS